jgi:1-phosphofructokinase family hexose kinase
LVLALNPSIDAEWRVDDLLWEEKNNVLCERRWAGGKGINVARWLRHLGGHPRLLLPLGGRAGAELARFLRAEKLSANVVPLRQPTRVNVIVTTNTGRQMRFNPPGPAVSGREWRAMLTAVRAGLERWDERPRAGAATLLILSGSLPRGVPVTAYARLIRLARGVGVRTLLDCDGTAFAAGVKARPFLVKPNEHELAQWWGRPLRSEKELVHASRALSRTTGGWVLVSRGARRALLVHESGKMGCFAQPPRLKVRNSVGAGDAMLAAVARQMQVGAPPQAWLFAGVAAGCAATRCAAGNLPAPRLLRSLRKQVRPARVPGLQNPA